VQANGARVTSCTYAAECTKQPPGVSGNPAAASQLHYGAAPRWLLSDCTVILGGTGKPSCCCRIISRIYCALCSRVKMSCSLLRPAHALASQHLRTLDVQAMLIPPFNSWTCHGQPYICLERQRARVRSGDEPQRQRERHRGAQRNNQGLELWRINQPGPHNVPVQSVTQKTITKGSTYWIDWQEPQGSRQRPLYCTL